MPLAVLLVEDDPADADLLIEALSETDAEQCQITHVKQLSVACKFLSDCCFDVVLLDLSLPDSQGLETVIQLQATAKDLPIVVLAGLDDRLLALQALAKGAQDYLVKGQITTEVLLRVIRYSIERGRILQQLQTEVQERQRSERTLRLIVEGTASVTGKDFFRSLVRSLAEALNVRYALISECIDFPPTRVHAFAFWQGNNFGENFEYDLRGTPCEQVINSQGCQYFPEQVQSLFPEEQGLVELQAQSYLGIALVDSAGKLLGHLAVLDDRSMQNESRNKAILEIFAARATAEMDRLQAESALQISEEKFSKAFHSSPNPITITSLMDGRFIEVNESCLRLLGYDYEEMIGHNALDLGTWAQPEDSNRMQQLLQKQGAVSNLELEFRKKSGEIFLGLLSAETIHLEDEPCLLAVTIDITALKQAEKALERLAEIGELASMIVHEVRNPLTTVLMGLNSLKRLNLSERFQESLALALDEADRLQRLLNQILLYAKPQTLQRSELDLNGFVAEMLNSLQSMPASSGRQLKFVSTPIPTKVLADRDKLKQVLINLVTNAFEAVDEGEVVTLKVQGDNAVQACIEVHNSGAPIPLEVLPKLTKPFYTTKSMGNGLGLAIVKRIVEAHGGELGIESSAVAGTTLKVKLPLMMRSDLNFLV